jgi:hypothetical protein
MRGHLLVGLTAYRDAHVPVPAEFSKPVCAMCLSRDSWTGPCACKPTSSWHVYRFKLLTLRDHDFLHGSLLATAVAGLGFDGMRAVAKVVELRGIVFLKVENGKTGSRHRSKKPILLVTELLYTRDGQYLATSCHLVRGYRIDKMLSTPFPR